MVEYIKICRPDHWLKNIFIVFGHVVAWALVLDFKLDWDLARLAVLSLIPACLIASANYILNEILDAPFDAMHPTKRHRGIPAGKVKVPILWLIKVALILGGFFLAWLWNFNWGYHAALLLLLLSGLVYNVPPLRLKDRAFADVIVFDPATVSDTATYTKPHSYSKGIDDVFVNGKAAVIDGKIAPERSGRILLRTR
jgi:4-hydroxybenzoate polyprenyltransferase